jgi:hypothetical protein
MAPATVIPDAALPERDVEGSRDDEPLLGRPGDASQQDGQPIYYNLIIGKLLISFIQSFLIISQKGTAVIAQAGIILLTASVWASILLQDLILFSAHPLLNSAGLLVLTESILILQPTHTQAQKRKGTIIHFTLNNLALDLLFAALILIEYNKIKGGSQHFHSIHGILGSITYIFLAVQALVGFTAYFVPKLYGGEDNAKSLYKWHRLSGYILLVLLLATVAAATQTDFNKNVIHIRLWAVSSTYEP